MHVGIEKAVYEEGGNVLLAILFFLSARSPLKKRLLGFFSGLGLARSLSQE